MVFLLLNNHCTASISNIFHLVVFLGILITSFVIDIFLPTSVVAVKLLGLQCVMQKF